jgi:hypothetical protein
MMLTVSLNIETIDAIIAWIDSQPAPLPWHMIDARETLKEELDNEWERRADDFFSYGGERAEND